MCQITFENLQIINTFKIKDVKLVKVKMSI